MTKGKTDTTKKQTPVPSAATSTKQEVHPRPAGTLRSVHNLGLFEQLTIFWLVISFTVFAVFNGVWFFHHKEISSATALPDSFRDFHALFKSAWKRENAFSAIIDTAISLIKSVWKANAISDKRLATSDITFQSLSAISLYFLAPASLVLAYGVAHRRRWRLALQAIVSTVTLTLLFSFFLNEAVIGFANINTKGDQHLVLGALTVAFAIPHFFLLLQSFFGTSTGLPYPRSHRISFSVKFFLGAAFVTTLILLVASIGHHYFDSKEVRAALKSGLEYSQVYANQAYQSASTVAADAAHQAHVLASPYIDQAAEFVHENIVGK